MWISHSPFEKRTRTELECKECKKWKTSCIESVYLGHRKIDT